MPRGSKEAYTDKQKRKAEHIEEGYEKKGVSHGEAERLRRLHDRIAANSLAAHVGIKAPSAISSAVAVAWSSSLKCPPFRSHQRRCDHGWTLRRP